MILIIYLKKISNGLYYTKTEFGGDDKENIPCTPSQNLYMTTSKDTIHVLRIAAILHILTSYIRKQLQLEVNDDPIDLTISLERLQNAIKLYSVLVQQFLYRYSHSCKHIYNILR